MRREGLQARGIYKEVPRPSRRLGLATRQKIPYIEALKEKNIIDVSYNKGRGGTQRKNRRSSRLKNLRSILAI